jgi:hypothetical protein
MSIADQKISVAIVVKICFFLASLLGVWYHNKYSVENLNAKVQKLEENYNSFNIQVIETNIRYNREHIDRLEQELKNKRDK